MNVVTLCAVLSFSKGRWRICARQSRPTGHSWATKSR